MSANHAVSMEGNQISIRILRDEESPEKDFHHLSKKLDDLHKHIAVARSVPASETESEEHIGLDYAVNTVSALHQAIQDINAWVEPRASRWRKPSNKSALKEVVHTLYDVIGGSWQLHTGAPPSTIGTDICLLFKSLIDVLQIAGNFDMDPEAVWITNPLHRIAADILQALSQTMVVGDGRDVFDDIMDDLITYTSNLRIKQHSPCSFIVSDLSSTMNELAVDHTDEAKGALFQTIVGGVKSVICMKVDGDLLEGLSKGLHCAYEMYKTYKSKDKVVIMSQLCPTPALNGVYASMKSSTTQLQQCQGNWLLTTLYINNAFRNVFIAINRLRSLQRDHDAPLEIAMQCVDLMHACVCGNEEVAGIIKLVRSVSRKRRSDVPLLAKIFDMEQLSETMHGIVQEALGELLEGTQEISVMVRRQVVITEDMCLRMDASTNMKNKKLDQEYRKLVYEMKESLKMSAQDIQVVDKHMATTQKHVHGISKAIDVLLSFRGLFDIKLCSFDDHCIRSLAQGVLDRALYIHQPGKIKSTNTANNDTIGELLRTIHNRVEHLQRDDADLMRAGGRLDYAFYASDLDKATDTVVSSILTEDVDKLGSDAPECLCCRYEMLVAKYIDHCGAVNEYLRKVTALYKIVERDSDSFADLKRLSSRGTDPVHFLRVNSTAAIDELSCHLHIFKVLLSHVSCCGEKKSKKFKSSKERPQKSKATNPPKKIGKNSISVSQVLKSVFSCGSKQTLDAVEDWATSQPGHIDTDTTRSIENGLERNGGAVTAKVVSTRFQPEFSLPTVVNGIILRIEATKQVFGTEIDVPDTSNVKHTTVKCADGTPDEFNAADKHIDTDNDKEFADDLDQENLLHFSHHLKLQDTAYSSHCNCEYGREVGNGCMSDKCFVHKCLPLIGSVLEGLAKTMNMLGKCLAKNVEDSGLVKVLRDNAVDPLPIEETDCNPNQHLESVQMKEIPRILSTAMLCLYVARQFADLSLSEDFFCVQNLISTLETVMLDYHRDIKNEKSLRVLRMNERRKVAACESLRNESDHVGRMVTSLHFASYALGYMEGVTSRIVDESNCGDIRNGSLEFCKPDSITEVEGANRSTAQALSDVASLEWAQALSGLIINFSGADRAMSLVRQGMKLLFGPGSKPERVEEAGISASVEIEVYLRSMLRVDTSMDSSLMLKIEDMLRRMSLQTTMARASSGNARVQRLLAQDNCAALVEYSAAENWSHVEETVMNGYHNDLLEYENVRVSLQEVNQSRQDAVFEEGKNGNSAFNAFLDALPTVLDSTIIENCIASTVDLCDTLTGKNCGVAGRMPSILSKLRRIRKDVEVSKGMSQIIVEKMDPRKIDSEGSYILRQVFYKPEGEWLLDPRGFDYPTEYFAKYKIEGAKGRNDNWVSGLPYCHNWQSMGNILFGRLVEIERALKRLNMRKGDNTVHQYDTSSSDHEEALEKINHKLNSLEHKLSGKQVIDVVMSQLTDILNIVSVRDNNTKVINKLAHTVDIIRRMIEERMGDDFTEEILDKMAQGFKGMKMQLQELNNITTDSTSTIHEGIEDARKEVQCFRKEFEENCGVVAASDQSTRDIITESREAIIASVADTHRVVVAGEDFLREVSSQINSAVNNCHSAEMTAISTIKDGVNSQLEDVHSTLKEQHSVLRTDIEGSIVHTTEEGVKIVDAVDRGFAVVSSRIDSFLPGQNDLASLIESKATETVTEVQKLHESSTSQLLNQVQTVHTATTTGNQYLNGLHSLVETQHKDLMETIISTCDKDSGRLAERIDAVGDRVQSVGEKVQTIGDGMQSMGDRVQSVGEKVQTIGDGMQSMGDKVQSVGDNVQSVGESMQLMGDRVQSVGEKVQTIGDDMQSIGDKVQSVGESMQSIVDVTTASRELIAQLAVDMQSNFDAIKIAISGMNHSVNPNGHIPHIDDIRDSLKNILVALQGMKGSTQEDLKKFYQNIEGLLQSQKKNYIWNIFKREPQISPGTPSPPSSVNLDPHFEKLAKGQSEMKSDLNSIGELTSSILEKIDGIGSDESDGSLASAMRDLSHVVIDVRESQADILKYLAAMQGGTAPLELPHHDLNLSSTNTMLQQSLEQLSLLRISVDNIPQVILSTSGLGEIRDMLERIPPSMLDFTQRLNVLQGSVEAIPRTDYVERFKEVTKLLEVLKNKKAPEIDWTPITSELTKIKTLLHMMKLFSKQPAAEPDGGKGSNGTQGPKGDSGELGKKDSGGGDGPGSGGGGMDPTALEFLHERLSILENMLNKVVIRSDIEDITSDMSDIKVSIHSMYDTMGELKPEMEMQTRELKGSIDTVSSSVVGAFIPVVDKQTVQLKEYIERTKTTAPDVASEIRNITEELTLNIKTMKEEFVGTLRPEIQQLSKEIIKKIESIVIPPIVIPDDEPTGSGDHVTVLRDILSRINVLLRRSESGSDDVMKEMQTINITLDEIKRLAKENRCRIKDNEVKATKEDRPPRRRKSSDKRIIDEEKESEEDASHRKTRPHSAQHDDHLNSRPKSSSRPTTAGSKGSTWRNRQSLTSSKKGDNDVLGEQWAAPPTELNKGVKFGGEERFKLGKTASKANFFQQNIGRYG